LSETLATTFDYPVKLPFGVLPCSLYPPLVQVITGILSPDIHGIQFPGREEPAIADLPAWPDGKKCVLFEADGRPCGYIQQTRYGIQKHCREAHGWVNRRARGGKPGTVAAGGKGEA
ncbi:hypothetical protein QBC38DRAFT_525341, partial [Podospora fimiseda]